MEPPRSYWMIFIWHLFIFPSNDAACTTSKNEMRWPLVPIICTQEIKLNADPISIMPCSLTFVDNYPNLTFPSPPPSVRLQGDAFIDLRVPNFNSLADYGFSAFVNPDSLLHSCIFNYKSDDNMFETKFISTPTESRIVINDSTSISVTHSPLVIGNWQKVGLGIDVSTGKIKMFVDRFTFDQYEPGEELSAQHTAPEIRTPGTLRVGGSFDGETYSGLVSCVGFNTDKNLDCSTNCYDAAIWSGVNVPVEKRHYGTFIPVMYGKEPVDTPVYVTSTENLTSCTLLCLRDFFVCATLTYDVITKACSLYSGSVLSGNTVTQMQASSPSITLYTLKGY